MTAVAACVLVAALLAVAAAPTTSAADGEHTVAWFSETTFSTPDGTPLFAAAPGACQPLAVEVRDGVGGAMPHADVRVASNLGDVLRGNADEHGVFIWDLCRDGTGDGLLTVSVDGAPDLLGAIRWSGIMAQATGPEYAWQGRDVTARAVATWDVGGDGVAGLSVTFQVGGGAVTSATSDQNGAAAATVQFPAAGKVPLALDVATTWHGIPVTLAPALMVQVEDCPPAPPDGSDPCAGAVSPGPSGADGSGGGGGGGGGGGAGSTGDAGSDGGESPPAGDGAANDDVGGIPGGHGDPVGGQGDEADPAVDRATVDGDGDEAASGGTDPKNGAGRRVGIGLAIGAGAIIAWLGLRRH